MPKPRCRRHATWTKALRRGGSTLWGAMRRRGLASKIVEASEAAARDAGAKLIKLHAQEYVLPLYAKAGYTQIAPVDYEDEGQPHVWMAKLLGDR